MGVHIPHPALFSDPRGVALICVFASVAIDFLGMAIVIPTLPAHVQALGGTAADFGYLLSAYSVASVISGFWMPWFADRFGCRKGFLVSLLGSSLGMLLQALATDFNTFLGCRFAAGMFSGSAGMAMAYISQVCAPAERPKYFPYVGTIIMSAFALGPGFGAGISSLTDDPLLKGQLPMYCACGLAATALLLAYFNLLAPDVLMQKGHVPPPADAKPDAPSGQESDASSASSAPVEVRPAAADGRRRLKIMAAMGMMSFLKSANYNVFPSTFGFLIGDEYGKDSAFFAFAFTASGIVVILNNMIVFSFLRKHLSTLPIGMVGAIVCAVATFLVPHMPSYGAALALLMIMMIGNGLIENIIPLVLADQATGKNAARVLAIGSQCAWAGHIGGPVMYSNVVESSGYKLAWLLAAALAGASCLMLAVVRAVQGGGSGAEGDKGSPMAQKSGDSASTSTALAQQASRTLDGAGDADASAGAAGVLESLLNDLREDLQKLLVERHYTEALDGSQHTATEVREAAQLVRQLVAAALPPLPAGSGTEHIRAYNRATRVASASTAPGFMARHN